MEHVHEADVELFPYEDPWLLRPDDGHVQRQATNALACQGLIYPDETFPKGGRD